jgi:hypothetical protein
LNLSYPQECYVAVGTSGLLQFFPDSARDPIEPRKQSMTDVPRRKTLEELKAEAIAKLERRGLNVRGKTPAQIRKLLSQQSKKQSSNKTGTGWRINKRG